MGKLKLGELFAGYGGLGLAVEEVFGAELAWYAEYDAAPSKIMAHHWPELTNYGDVTAVDWAQVPPVDIISGRSPCQDLSLAGARKGMTDGTRSNLWESMREAIATIKPTYVVWENVRGALSATATSASDMGQSEGFLGERGGHLRALGRVLGDLADLGYDAQWRGLRAADVGAPHGRFRIFILATTQDTHLAVGSEWRIPAPGQAESGRSRADTGRRGGTPTANASSHESERRGIGRDMGSASAASQGDSKEWQRLRNTLGDSCAAPADTTSSRPRGREDRGAGGGHESQDGRWGVQPERSGGEHPSPINWGSYEPAIRRWEAVRGTAPAPTEPTAKGKHRLSAKFAEWMMGVPNGWITDVPGISRNDQLKAAGNGVVPQQAAAALRDMLEANHAN